MHLARLAVVATTLALMLGTWSLPALSQNFTDNPNPGHGKGSSHDCTCVIKPEKPEPSYLRPHPVALFSTGPAGGVLVPHPGYRVKKPRLPVNHTVNVFRQVRVTMDQTPKTPGGLLSSIETEGGGWNCWMDVRYKVVVDCDSDSLLVVSQLVTFNATFGVERDEGLGGPWVTYKGKSSVDARHDLELKIRGEPIQDFDSLSQGTTNSMLGSTEEEAIDNHVEDFPNDRKLQVGNRFFIVFNFEEVLFTSYVVPAGKTTGSITISQGLNANLERPVGAGVLPVGGGADPFANNWVYTTHKWMGRSDFGLDSDELVCRLLPLPF